MKFILCSMLLIGSVSVMAAGTTTTTKTKMTNETSKMSPSQMDDLIRGEMSAVKSYDEALKKLKNDDEKAKLTAMKQDHQNAVDKLKAHATADVREDTKSAGVWGAFSEAWTGGASLFGDKTAMKALLQGEEHGVNEYREALKDKNVSPEVKTLIKTELLPKQEAHSKELKKLI